MKRKFTTDHLPFNSLALDPAYQRELIPARVKYLVKNWNIEDVGAITVSIRAGDTKKAYIIDGQHRYRAAMELGLGTTKVLCHVYRGLSEAEEARKFLSANDSRSVSPFDKYRAGLAADDPLAVGTQATAESHGWKVSNVSRDGTIGCVGEAMKLESRGLLDDTLKVVTEAWGTTSASVEAPILGGLALVLDRYNGELDRGALIKKLAKASTAASFLGRAKTQKEYTNTTVRRSVADLVVATYNKGRRSGQLPVL